MEGRRLIRCTFYLGGRQMAVRCYKGKGISCSFYWNPSLALMYDDTSFLEISIKGFDGV
jgi:hypothetical protein